MAEGKPDPVERGRGRPTLAFVTANIHLGVGATLWSGVLTAAERGDVNVICFPGGEMRAADSPRNAVYDLVTPHRLDGLICWTSTLGSRADDDRATGLARRFAGLPVVSLNRPLGDHQTLTLDSYRGMCAAISHLIEAHGRRRLAFIRGPVANPVARERYRAYTDTLARYRITLDRTLVSAPVEFRRQAGAAAMRVLLDVRGLSPGRDFDAVVACSDVLAADALKILSGRAVQVPADIAVISFNDSPEAQHTDPPLTSVSIPFAALGELAVDTLLARLRGTSPPAQGAVAAELVVRRSCGCPAPPVTDPETALRALEYERWQEEQTSQHLRDIGNALISAKDESELTSVLAERLPRIGIRGCALSLYENPLRGCARLVLGCDERGVRDTDGTPYPAGRLVPDGVLPGNRRFSLVAEPLHLGEEQLGFALFEPGPRHGSVYRALGDQISAGLQGARLFREVLTARDTAEKADRLKTRLLASVSDELRAPLNAILEHTSRALSVSGLPLDLAAELKEVHLSAEQQLGLITDLLDLSRAEIDALDLSPELLDPRALLGEVFRPAPGRLLRLPRRLPVIRADRLRLRQVLVNLLESVERFAHGGKVIVSVDVRPPRLHIRVTCPDTDIPADLAGHIFEPFAGSGMGLGLAIARRLVTLHDGSITLRRDSDGDSFHLRLPLPSPGEQPAVADTHDTLLLVAAAPAELVELGRSLGLRVRELRVGDDVAATLADIRPAAVAWDLTGTRPQDWSLIRHLHDHPRLRQTPFMLYGDLDGDEARAVHGRDLDEAIRILRPAESTGPIVIADSAADTRARYRRLLWRIRPGHPVLLAPDGTTALGMLGHEVASLVVLAQALPDMDGFDVVDRMRCDPRLAEVPVLVVSDRTLTLDDVRRTEPHPGVVLQSKGILSDAETTELLTRLLEHTDPVPHRTGLLVKRALAYLHQNYNHQVTRRQIAQAAGVSEDYLSRMFHRELGLSPWDYLNRLRVQQAKERLRHSDDSIQVVARRVGFRDRAYFSRVFRKVTGVAPQAFRETPDSPSSGRS